MIDGIKLPEDMNMFDEINMIDEINLPEDMNMIDEINMIDGIKLPEDINDIEAYVSVLILITKNTKRYEELKRKESSDFELVNIINLSELAAIEVILATFNKLLVEIENHPQYEDIKMLAAIRS